MLWSCISIFVVLTSSVQSAIVGRDNACEHLNGTYNCVEIKECPSIYQLVNLTPSPPLPNDVLQIIRRNHCGFKGKNPLVCCSYKAKEVPVLPAVELPVPIPTTHAVSKYDILFNMLLNDDLVIENYLDDQ